MTYIKITCVVLSAPPSKRMQHATICLEDVSTVGPTSEHYGLSEDYMSAQPIMVRMLTLRPGQVIVVTPEVGAEIEEGLLNLKSITTTPSDREGVLYVQCLCECPRCQMFPGPHAETHQDCCGRQKRGDTWKAP